MIKGKLSALKAGAHFIVAGTGFLAFAAAPGKGAVTAAGAAADTLAGVPGAGAGAIVILS